MDAFLGDTDDAGRMSSFGKVAIVAVVGNEDGAYHVSAELYQALNDVGFTLAPVAATYWGGAQRRPPGRLPAATSLPGAVAGTVRLPAPVPRSPRQCPTNPVWYPWGLPLWRGRQPSTEWL
jgi:hypothetical protein